jgi:small subunit ribosomal protein S8e
MATKKGKKISGGRYKKQRKKKADESSSQERIVKLGKNKKKNLRIKGGDKKTVLLSSNLVNVLTGKNKVQKINIKNVLETPSNRFLARQNIITKGTIVETELGKVKITNRPSQDSSINGILLKE